MKVFIAFEGLCESFDVLPSQTVQSVKQMIKDYFHIQLSNDKQGRRYLELLHAGAVLKDDWILVDVGITLCSTIKCIIKEEDKPALFVYNAVTRETIPISGNIYLLATTISKLKTLITLKCGFPIGVYCLRTSQGKEMYNCNTLNDYKIELGTMLRLDAWDGWKEFLSGCISGHICNVQKYLSAEKPVLRYQQKVVLYMAACFGHLELAKWVLKLGARADEAVGVHPYREWCCETDHPDIAKCPIHAAAEAGQLLILKTFINFNILCLECPNPLGQTPLKICIKHKHKDCVRYLVMKIWSMVSYPKLSLPMKIYIKMKRWLYVAQKHVLAKKWFSRATTFKTRVGDTVLVDGFSEPKMSSTGLYKATRKSKETKSYKLPVLRNAKHSGVKSDHGATTLQSQNIQNFKLPVIEHTNPEPQEMRMVSRTENNNMLMPQIPLPPISSISALRPQYYSAPKATLLISSSLQTFSEHSGRTPRENAIYCLALASEFKEKPWLQQLEMAKALAKKTICRPAR
ncbi:protein ANKUB1 isoform X1 [Microcaecilia unicolor]|uniref:Protein ANKUB1 isoform X1 n=1 Tax=Microcaecilia unicolor TaxID=1415580 RepID=A0A6P7YXU6_9AMPH|nr:protein ANKUB1 isoform X1 [Microcaecilia unicolor]